MTQMKSTTMTTCGHRYCAKCINEWVDRRHNCPCCNTHLDLNQLIKDHQFDSMMASIQTEKEKSEASYFESLINSAASSSQNDGTHNLSPVEEVLKNHLKKSLAAHEKYFQTLKKEFKQKLNKLESDTDEAILQLKTHGLSFEELSQQTGDLKTTLERQKEETQQELDTCAKLIAEAYDKYLTTYIPNLEVLPVKTSINFMDKDTKISDVLLNPKDNVIQRIRATTEAAMKARSNPVIKWPDDAVFVLFGPFAKCSQCEMEQKIMDILYNGKEYSDVTVLSPQSDRVLQLNIKPGSEIAIYGNVKCESDLPKRCFVECFKNGEQQKCDYFLCKQCGFQWICRSCMEVCHKGHEIMPYIMNHQPTWACCYCPKKKTCILQQ